MPELSYLELDQLFELVLRDWIIKEDKRVGETVLQAKVTYLMKPRQA